mgnify:FL=1
MDVFLTLLGKIHSVRNSIAITNKTTPPFGGVVVCRDCGRVMCRKTLLKNYKGGKMRFFAMLLITCSLYFALRPLRLQGITTPIILLSNVAWMILCSFVVHLVALSASLASPAYLEMKLGIAVVVTLIQMLPAFLLMRSAWSVRGEIERENQEQNNNTGRRVIWLD